MKVMGLSDLHLVLPRQFPHPDADARATGAVDLLHKTHIHPTLDQALIGTQLAYALSARTRELGPPLMPPREAATHLVAALEHHAQTVALVFGNETNGLDNAEINRCQARIAIPTDPDFSSLNLGAAVQVMAYELRLAAFSNKQPAPLLVPPLTNPATPAPHEVMEGFYQHLERVMVNTGFLDPQHPRRLLPKLRRFFRRAAPDQEEINILRGILSATEQPTGPRHPANQGSKEKP